MISDRTICADCVADNGWTVRETTPHSGGICSVCMERKPVIYKFANVNYGINKPKRGRAMKAAVVVAAAVLMAVSAAAEPEAIRVEAVEGGAMVGVNMWGGPKAAYSRVKDAVVNNPGKTALAVLGVVALDRAAHNNGWLWHHDRRDGGNGDVSADTADSGNTTQTGTGSMVVNINVTGDSNTISVRRNEPE